MGCFFWIYKEEKTITPHKKTEFTPPNGVDGKFCFLLFKFSLLSTKLIIKRLISENYNMSRPAWKAGHYMHIFYLRNLIYYYQLTKEVIAVADRRDTPCCIPRSVVRSSPPGRVVSSSSSLPARPPTVHGRPPVCLQVRELLLL